MKEKPLLLILDRNRFKVEAEQFFPKQIDTLIDMVNYGTNLVARAYDSSKKKLEDIIVIIVLLKQVISMIDAIQVLISQGIVNAAYLPLRSAFESSLYIDWVLKSESKKKAEYYYVSNLRDIKLWTLRYLHGTKENKQWLEFMKDLKDFVEPSTVTKKEEEEAKKQIKDIDRILSQEGFCEINTVFENSKRKKTGIDAKWYTLLGISSIKELAEDVGRLSEYHLFYQRGSEVMHSTSYQESVKFGKGKISFEPIRKINNMPELLELTMGLCLHVYHTIITKYRSGERSLGKKFVNDWKDSYQKMPSVKYTDN